LQRGIEASAARYVALAARHVAKSDGIQRGIDASAARYSAMGAHYNTFVAVSVEGGGV
jgi:hypothetical protein